MRNQQRQEKNSAGFTLIEVIVATAVFLVVMLISATSLLSLIDANRKAQSQKSVINNLNFALDSMTRSIRVGTTYHCSSVAPLDAPLDCPSGSSFFAFEHTDGSPSISTDQTAYRLANNRIERSTDSGQNFEAVTASSVIVDDLEFTVVGSNPSDDLQPYVIINIRGRSGAQGESESRFDIQTMVSQRIVD